MGVKTRAHLACEGSSRLKGLLGKEDFDGILLLAPCRDIHTVGMSMAIDVAFISDEGRVIDVHRDVGPGRRMRCRRACAAVERKACPEEPWFCIGEYVWIESSYPQHRDTAVRPLRAVPAHVRRDKARFARGSERKTVEGDLR